MFCIGFYMFYICFYMFFIRLCFYIFLKTHNRYMDRQTDRQIDRQTDRQTNRQTDRQTDKQTDRWRDRHVWPRGWASLGSPEPPHLGTAMKDHQALKTIWTKIMNIIRTEFFKDQERTVEQFSVLVSMCVVIAHVILSPSLPFPALPGGKRDFYVNVCWCVRSSLLHTRFLRITISIAPAERIWLPRSDVWGRRSERKKENGSRMLLSLGSWSGAMHESR